MSGEWLTVRYDFRFIGGEGPSLFPYGFWASAGYDSTQQRYQLFVPKSYRKDKPTAMVLFISPGDQPGSFKNWQKLCESEGVFFASPFGAGNTTAPGVRTRIILDVLDDVRRQ